MQNDFGTSATEQRVIDPQPDSLSNMAQLVEIIATARYGMADGEMGFETDTSEDTVQIAFGPLGKNYKTVEALKEGDPAFYKSMHNFLSDLEDVATGPLFAVDAENLIIAAKTKMIMFDALQMMVEEEWLNLSTMDDAGVLKTKEELSWSSAEVCSRIKDLAQGCDALKKKHEDTFEYFLLNAPVKPYLSLEHFKACLASRAEVDVPMSMSNLKKQILLEEYSGDKLVANLAKRGVYYN